MIVGTGMMAKAFEGKINDENIIVFASGVSNSLETRQSEFERERLLLQEVIKNNKEKKMIYFSTCSIDDDAVSDRMYVKHKLLMENYIFESCSHYLICRISNVVGNKGNPHTLINYLYDCILKSIPFEAWINSERNIIDVDDVVYYVSKLNELNIENKIMNVANSKSYRVIDIIEAIEKYCGRKGIYEKVNKGVALTIDTTYLNSIVKKNSIESNDAEEYITSILKKYFVNA